MLRDALIDEPGMPLLAACAVVADAAIAVHAQAQEVCAQRQLHQQQGLKTPPGELFPECPHAAESIALGEWQQFHAGQPLQQLGLSGTQNPAQSRVRTLLGKGMHERQHMADIPKRGQPQQADTGSFRHRGYAVPRK